MIELAAVHHALEVAVGVPAAGHADQQELALQLVEAILRLLRPAITDRQTVVNSILSNEFVRTDQCRERVDGHSHTKRFLKNMSDEYFFGIYTTKQRNTVRIINE